MTSSLSARAKSPRSRYTKGDDDDSDDGDGECPRCGSALRVERRGGDWFAWCANGPWGQGCSGINGFGLTKGLARLAACALFNTL